MDLIKWMEIRLVRRRTDEKISIANLFKYQCTSIYCDHSSNQVLLNAIGVFEMPEMPSWKCIISLNETALIPSCSASNSQYY